MTNSTLLKLGNAKAAINNIVTSFSSSDNLGQFRSVQMIRRSTNRIETAIFHLPPEASNDSRQRAVNILRKAKQPSQNISREERLALRNLRQNNNILILPADKGNATVVIDKKVYCNKINVMLSDCSVYGKLKRNPTFTIEKKTSVLLKNSGLPPEIIKYLTPRKSSAPRFYGLPKIYKESVPFCPIISNIGRPSYQLARYFTKPLQKLTGHNGSHIKNSIDFVNKITKIKTTTNDILVSFDAVSLFTNVPVHDTLDIIKKSDKLPANFVPLIEHCLTSTYFQFQEEFFEQTSGVAMGYPVLPIIANIFMEHLEDKILKNAPLKPSTWTDTAVSEPTFLDEKLQHLNQTLTRNGYNSKNINQITKRLKNKISSPNDTENLDEERENKMTAVLPYLQRTTERIGRILSKHNIRVIFKLQKKIAQLLPNPKDQRPSLETPGVYKIPCVCGKVYIGETGRKISTRNTRGVPNTATFHNQPWRNIGWRLDMPCSMISLPCWPRHKATLLENIEKVWKS
ncbi:uncharacterized protein LOC105205165 [Solenopsis invicta]|uniref:uncharacterized protein LOC105205165 n=1 Tax=Solenopsis invicta TaxID=13686 RepID=UPI00193E17A4|nr:uncharacterized protein LOC105205165 [Solenopsis invicta]